MQADTPSSPSITARPIREEESESTPVSPYPSQDNTRSTNSGTTATSKGSQGPEIVQQLKNNKIRQKSKIEAVEAVVNHQDLDRDINSINRVLMKARVCWKQVDELLYQYDSLIEEAFEVLGETNADLMAELATNDNKKRMD